MSDVRSRKLTLSQKLLLSIGFPLAFLAGLEILFRMLAVTDRLTAKGPELQLEMPTWMTSIESTTAPKALVLGAVLSRANPKNFALTLVAAALVAETGLDETSTAIVLAIFVLLGSITVAGAVLFHLVAPRRRRRNSPESESSWWTTPP